MPSTNYLSGECVCFVRVTPGYITQAIKELASEPNVTGCEPCTGMYDLVVTGKWPDLETWNSFREKYESRPWWLGCDFSPSVNTWTRSSKPTSRLPINGWTMIQTSNATKTMHALRDLPNVYKIYTTTGPYNLICYYYVNQPTDFLTIVTNTFHGFKEIRRTETHISFPSHEIS